MSKRSYTAALLGTEASLVTVEADVANGLPNFIMVGLPDMSVRESRERIRLAISQSGLPFPRTRITVNLAPAELRKEGSGFDLAIALAVLAATEVIDAQKLEQLVVLGELGLDGLLRPVRGSLPVALMAKRLGRDFLAHELNVVEAAMIPGLVARPACSLKQIVDWLNGGAEIGVVNEKNTAPVIKSTAGVNFSTIRGHHLAKRALEIAAAGGHNLRMVGPPGSGKTLLARALMGILPPLTADEALDVAVMTSIRRSPAHMAVKVAITRPFRAPHHTTTTISLIGGGAMPMPGEVCLADRGVLFLDELPEFSRPTLEALRQPLEDGVITIARARAQITFPCRAMVIAAHNPCPCGYFGDDKCQCSASTVAEYKNRISGPLLDRFDLHIQVPRLAFDDLFGLCVPESSSVIGERVTLARRRQLVRYAGTKQITNSELDADGLNKYVQLDRPAVEALKKVAAQFDLSARAYARIIKVGRTIADLAGLEEVGADQIAEAVQYRMV